MLDTNIISDLVRNPQGKAAKRIAKVGEICTSIIVAAELRYGCAKSGSTRLLKAVEDLLGEIEVLPLDVPADTEYGGIRSELEAAGKPIGSSDLLIAAHAFTAGVTIVTANSDECLVRDRPMTPQRDALQSTNLRRSAILHDAPGVSGYPSIAGPNCFRDGRDGLKADIRRNDLHPESRRCESEDRPNSLRAESLRSK
jgi:tRNA(fMet)-specific endonuclease VapC